MVTVKYNNKTYTAKTFLLTYLIFRCVVFKNLHINYPFRVKFSKFIFHKHPYLLCKFTHIIMENVDGRPLVRNNVS